MRRFDGQKDPDRRMAAARGDAGMREYRKTATIYAVRMAEAFQVHTIEGLHDGKAGDWLAIGVAGEMYPIDAEVFAATYEEVP